MIDTQQEAGEGGANCVPSASAQLPTGSVAFSLLSSFRTQMVGIHPSS